MSQYWFLVVTHVLWLWNMLTKGEIGQECMGVFCFISAFSVNRKLFRSRKFIFLKKT